MDFIQSIREKAKSNLKTIIIPEGTEERVLQAAGTVLKEGLAKLVILGNKDMIYKKAKENSFDIDKAIIVDPASDPNRDGYIEEYYKLRQAKGITLDDAKNLLLDELVFYGAMMVRRGIGDGFVAGASFETRDVARAAIHCISIDKDIGVVSGAFIMIAPDKSYGEDGLFIFADCAIIPQPRYTQLANIAIASARLMERLFDIKGRVAMLSFSTKGSASDPTVDKVIEATKLAKELKPDLIIDGELQVDAAIVPGVAQIKAPDSILKGRANILIFPDLSSGNIAYKIVQRLAKAHAIGPLILGLVKPCSDLSRGCLVEDIIDAIATTAVMAQDT